MVKKIRKRDGSIVHFEKEKIAKAIWKAVQSVGGQDREKVDSLVDMIVLTLDKKYGEQGIPDVEVVQDLVEKILIEMGHAQTAKAYILYRKTHEELRNVKGLFDTIEAVEDYIGFNDWMVKENSNMDFSLQGLNNYIATKIITNYWMRRIYPEAIRKAHESAELHIHDLGTLGAYCFDDKTKILTESGWKYFKDVKKGEKVATKNLKTGKLEFQVPYDKQVYNYSGEMYSFEGRGVSLLVTPEHRLLVRRKDKKEWEFVCPPDFKYGMEFDKRLSWNGKKIKDFKIPKVSRGNRKKEIGNFDIKDYLKFMGWYLSEGSSYEPSSGDYRISIAQSRGKYREEIKNLLKKMKISFNDSSKFNIHLHSKELFYYLKKFGISKNKYVPQQIKELNPALIKIFLTALFKGDGSFSNGKFLKYYTNSIKLAEDVVECLLKINLCGTVSKKKGREMYFVSVENKHLTPIYRKKIVKKKYSGRVYDFSVKNGTLVVMREGKVVVSGNCVGWDLKDLLTVGFKGVKGKVESKPPKHLRTALGQMVNFFYTLQGETAGAQAFSNFDTLLAPYVRYDNLDYKNLKQTMQEFIFNLAVPTRVGFQCMSEDTEILTPFGWRSHNELRVGDTIKTFNVKKGIIEDKPIKKLFSKKYIGIMYNLKNRIQDQLISPHHRVVRRKFSSSKYVLEEIEETMKNKSPFIVPICGENKNKDYNIKDEKIKLLAWIIGEGSIERKGKHRCCSRVSIYQSKIKNPKNYNEIKGLLRYFNLKFSEYTQKGLGYDIQRMRLNASSSKKIHKWFKTKESVGFVPDYLLNMSKKQSKLFIDTYLKAEGFEDCKIATTSVDILDSLQQIAFNSGYGSSILVRSPTIGKKLIYVLRLIKHKETYIQKVETVNYSGIIWCPNTDNETVVARRNGKVFITGNTPFTNITMDLKVPSYMKDENVVIGGELKKETYKDFQKEMDMINKSFAEIMIEGDAAGRVFTFPIPTYNITKDFDWENPQYNLIWEMTAKYGIPYFSNFVNSDMKPEDARSMCCRLRLNTKELRTRGGGLFGANPQTGSIGVVTINMPRLGFTSVNEEDFFKKLGQLMELAKESLEIKRKVIENFTEVGLYPYSKFYLRMVHQRFGQYWKNHFATIGLLGMNEAIVNFMPGEDITTQKGKKFAEKVLDFMREKLEEFQEETGNIYNLEATPGEGTSHRFARIDKQRLGRIIVANNEAVKIGGKAYYTNSTQLPVNAHLDLFEALELQDSLQAKYTGGCIEKGNKVLTDKGLIKIEDIVKNFKSLKPLRALSYNLSKNISEWDEITDAVSIDVKKHNKINIKGEKNLDIVTSDWHPFFVLEKIKPESSCPVCNEKVSGIKAFASHIKNSKKCCEKYKKLNKYKIIEKRADEICKGDYILQNSSNLYPNKKTNLDDDFMWLIGFFIGDGCISKFIDNRGGNNLEKYKIRFFSSSNNALNNVKRILSEKFNAEVSVIKNDSRSNVLNEVGTSKKEVLDFFFEIGFYSGKKTDSIFIPKYVKDNLNFWNVYSFLSGLMDSDGHISKRDGDLEYSTISSRLANDLLEVFTTAGINTGKYIKRTKRANEKDIHRIRIPAYYMTTIKNKLKVNVNLLNIKEDLSNRKKRYLPVVRARDTSKIRVKDNLFYDLTTKKNHNYLAGKDCLIFVHNTVFHAFVGEKLDKDAVKKIVKKISDNFHLPYFTISPVFSICPVHGYLAGEHEYCPKCDEELEMKRKPNETSVSNIPQLNKGGEIDGR